MIMKSILITGCNRGLGLGLVKCLVKEKNPPKSIIATCRDLNKAQARLGNNSGGTKIANLFQELQGIAESNNNVHILQLDVEDTETFDEFARNVQEIVKDNGLNVLFNNAGYSPKSTRINMVKAQQMIDTFRINTVGPIMLTKALLPALKKASEVNCNHPLGSSRSAVINMSTILGSISKNCEGGLYPYRCSKAALNIATKSLSIDLKKDGILVTCVHPGWVKTDMGGSHAPIDVESSAKGLVTLMTSLSEKHNGEFYTWEGKALPW
ncbi:unnamed protein product [Phaedon cochleariae]|uniref:C-factor n=1 Tax=Phaedon cochleariae TaxID=80249 RepID=A0A9P0DNA5_PHACE|nr:unnamed protein product [Phaedon cochleariae]